MNAQSKTSLPAINPAKSPSLPDGTSDPFGLVVDSNHGAYCRSVETEIRDRIYREEEQVRLEAFMRAANAD